MTRVIAFVALVAALVPAVADGPKIGDAAPAFSLQDHQGNAVSLADFKDKIVVLEWFNNECPFVVKHYREGHMNQLVSKYKEQGVVWVAINSTKGKSNADNLKIAEAWKMQHPVLNDASGAIGKAYGAKTTPHMFVIDRAGKVAFAGAIDSDNSARTQAVAGAKNYVAQALDELLAGKPVSEPIIRSYGCSVKYARP